jgi:hypothetical protein
VRFTKTGRRKRTDYTEPFALKKFCGMRGSTEWRSLLEQELADLLRLLDRKADHLQLSHYRPAVPPLPTTAPPARGDCQTDFATLFSAFNRVARQKLDTSTLSEFAGVPFVDSLYQRRSVHMSAQLTEMCTLYNELFEKRLNVLRDQIREFEVQVLQRVAALNERVGQLQLLLRKLFGPIERQVKRAGSYTAARTISPIGRVPIADALAVPVQPLSRTLGAARPRGIGVTVPVTTTPDID